MNCAFALALVDEPDHSFPSLLHHESGTRGDTVIANECRWLFARVDLCLEFFDDNLVVVDWNAGCSIS
jgi:hypothetical protein